MSAAEKANLARIRDNQRRSRARRKEYLQELEARLRQCELQGIEASAEIQLAARRVADENKKLRVLLSQHGVGDDTIDSFLQSAASPDTMIGGSFSGLGGMGSSGAVQVLEHLLHTRKPCCADGNTGAPGPMTSNGGGGSRDSSATSMSTVQSIWDSTYSSHIKSQNGSAHMDGSDKSAQRHFMSPPMTASRTGSVASTRRGGSLGGGQQQQPQQQHRSRIPSIAPSMASSASAATTSSQQTQSLYEFDSHSMHASFHSHQQHQSHNNISSSSQHSQAHNHLAPLSRSSQYRPTVATSTTVGGTNSCGFAADMISTMAGGDPNDVRADLGCLQNNMECEVDNHLVFNVLDRYTGQSIGL